MVYLLCQVRSWGAWCVTPSCRCAVIDSYVRVTPDHARHDPRPNTRSLPAATRTAASAALKGKEQEAGFCGDLIEVIAGPCPAAELPTKLSAATYLKNFVKSRWNHKTIVRRSAVSAARSRGSS